MLYPNISRNQEVPTVTFELRSRWVATAGRLLTIYLYHDITGRPTDYHQHHHTSHPYEMTPVLEMTPLLDR